MEGAEYAIEVVALSEDDQQSVSDKITVIFPGFKSIRAASTGIIVGLAFLGTTFFVVYIMRKYSCRRYQHNAKKWTSYLITRKKRIWKDYQYEKLIQVKLNLFIDNLVCYRADIYDIQKLRKFCGLCYLCKIW